MSYTASEVQAVLDSYMDILAAGRPNVRAIDIQIAMNQIPSSLREAAFYLGVCQMTTRDAADFLSVPRNRLSERYRWAIEELLVRLN